MLLGETGVTAEQVNFEQVARDVAKQIGYTHDDIGLDGGKCNVIVNVQAQS